MPIHLDTGTEINIVIKKVVNELLARELYRVKQVKGDMSCTFSYSSNTQKTTNGNILRVKVKIQEHSIKLKFIIIEKGIEYLIMGRKTMIKRNLELSVIKGKATWCEDGEEEVEIPLLTKDEVSELLNKRNYGKFKMNRISKKTNIKPHYKLTKHWANGLHTHQS